MFTKMLISKITFPPVPKTLGPGRGHLLELREAREGPGDPAVLEPPGNTSQICISHSSSHRTRATRTHDPLLTQSPLPQVQGGAGRTLAFLAARPLNTSLPGSF